jgi:hypothetical protein
LCNFFIILAFDVVKVNASGKIHVKTVLWQHIQLLFDKTNGFKPGIIGTVMPSFSTNSKKTFGYQKHLCDDVFPHHFLFSFQKKVNIALARTSCFRIGCDYANQFVMNFEVLHQITTCIQGFNHLDQTICIIMTFFEVHRMGFVFAASPRHHILIPKKSNQSKKFSGVFFLLHNICGMASTLYLF